MNIFWREMKSHYKPLIGWSVGMIFMVVAGMGKFEGFSTTGNSGITGLVDKFPKAMLAVFGMTGLDLTKLIGYFGVLYLYVILMVAIHAGMLGAGIISKEELDKTSEFLYVKPVSRSRVLMEKMLAGLTIILILLGVTAISSVWIVGFYNKNYDLNSQVFLLMAGVFMFQLLSFAFGVFFAGIFKNPKLPATAVTSVIMASYLVSVMVELNSKLDFLKNLTPFQYFGAPKILAEGRLDPLFLGIALSVSVVLLILTYFFYNRRDISV